MADATYASPDLTTFTRLDEMGLVVLGQRLEPGGAGLRGRRTRSVVPALWVRGPSAACHMRSRPRSRGLGYRFQPSIDERNDTAHRFVRGTSTVDLVAGAHEKDQVDVLIADHPAPRVIEKLAAEGPTDAPA